MWRTQLVVTPGQFRASGVVSPTTGTERLYNSLQFDVYRAPFSDTDFVAPSIWQVQAFGIGGTVTFNVLVTDDSGQVPRVVLLYRLVGTKAWTKAELNYDPATQRATKTVTGLNGPIEYFAQAVDPSGNVALALDHGNAFTQVSTLNLYLPLIMR